MARIVLATFGSFGDVYPYMKLALELGHRGHRPVLAMPGVFRETIAQAGLEFRAVRPDLNLTDRAQAARLMDASRGTDALFNELLIPSLSASYDDLMETAGDADLLVTHPASLTGPIVAEKLERPWISTVLAPMSFFSVSDPVVPPPAPWLHRYLERSLTLSRLFVWLSDRMTRRWARPVQRLRISKGLNAGDNPILAGQHSPYRVLALFSTLLASPQPDWPAQVQVVGPILYNGPSETSLGDEIEAFLGAGSPPIVFTLGTSAVEAAGRFYEVAAQAAARLGRRAVLLVGRHADNRPSASSANVLPVAYAPHGALFPRAAAIVHQGGAGTLHQALASGRPALVVPHAHDQPDNARRLERLGVARTLYPQRFTEENVSRELEALLETPSYATRAIEAAAVVRGENGAVRAADEVEDVLGHRTQRPRRR